jgi:hypothetical protein
MKHYIKHIIQNNLQEVVEKSLLNCHIIGLHSIMISDASDRMIRLYIADKGHQLHKNLPINYENGLSVGFHSHHCDLSLHCIKGKIFNWVVEEADTGFELTKYNYSSKITSDEMGFTNTGKSYLTTTSEVWITEENMLTMGAKQIHTVGCDKDSFNAWLVYQGKEDKTYTSYCWSNANLEKEKGENLYLKPTETQVLELLRKCDLI